MEEIKKEAKRLIELFNSNCWECGGYEQAKQCALICIDEKIKMINGSLDSEELNYYIAVKDYITNNY